MDYLNSFFQNIKDKLTNPFFGTLIVILIINHWELWYTLFNFDANESRDSRIGILTTLASKEFIGSNILYDGLWAIIISIGGYLIVVITRTLSLFIEFRIMPWITGKVISKNVVLKATYDETVTERDEYSDKYEEQRKNVRIISKNYDEQTELIKKKNTELAKKSESLSTLTENFNVKLQEVQEFERELDTSNGKITELESSIEALKNRQAISLTELEAFRTMFFSEENRQFWNSLYKFPPVVIDKARELKKKGEWQHFLSVANFVEFGGTISAESVTEMKEAGLLYDGLHTEQFTPVGEILYRYKSLLKSVV